ncbi:MAG: hypothetical protein IJ058_00310 [Lachnospiraceae bacterium]|nr:hypothetical protein [Lachnospiraceae bacterium]
MSKFNKAVNIIFGIATIILAVVMVVDTEFGYLTATVILSATLMLYGIRHLSFYISMGRSMVGGQQMLYVGIVMLDLGLFTLSIVDVPKFYVMLYLLLGNAFTGLIGIMRGLEARKINAPSWKIKVAEGIFFMIVSIGCGVFVRSMSILVYVYCAQLVYSAIMRIVSALRRTEIVYIQ